MLILFKSGIRLVHFYLPLSARWSIWIPPGGGGGRGQDGDDEKYYTPGLYKIPNYRIKGLYQTIIYRCNEIGI